MKKSIIILCFLLLISILAKAQGQKLRAYFETKNGIDTLASGSKEDVSHTVNVLIPKQDIFKDAKVELSYAESEFSPPASELYLPSDRFIKVEAAEDMQKKSFALKFKRNKKDDRLIILKLSAVDKDGKPLELAKDAYTTLKIYVKPLVADSLINKNGYEAWLYTGTNLDLLDGVKLKELYFKGSFLFKLRNDLEKTRSWLYVNFGKNRFFSERDTITRISLTDIIQTPGRSDSITLVSGFYNTLAETQTENTFGSIEYLYQLSNLESKASSLLASLGFYYGLQNIKKTFSNFNIVADTSKFLRNPDTTYRFTPLAREQKIRQFNYNISLGLMHIFSNSKVNIKTQLSTGLNFFNYPERIITQGINRVEFYKKDKNLYTLLRIDATVLNPGISLGFETFIRRGQALFNVSLTKVLDLEQLKSLFGAVSSVKN